MSFFDKLENLFKKWKKKWLRFLANHRITRYFLEKYLLTERKNPNPIANRKKSLLLVVGVICLLSSLIVSRLLYVTIAKKVDNVSLSEKTRQLYQGEREIIAKRGTIYDRNGIPIAEDSTKYVVYAVLDKKYIGIHNKKLYVQDKDIDKIARIFHKYLDMKESYTEKRLEKNLKQVEFGTKGQRISLETRNEIQKELKKEKITGIYFYEQQDRMYPNGVFASHLIGYAQPKNIKNSNLQELTGVMGIEAAYNKQLAGKNGLEVFQQDGNGLPLPGTNVISKKAENGKDIYTTLDANLQVYLESLMTEVDKTYHPESMFIAVMQAKTGEILATSQRPTFNPETKAGLTSSKKDKNDKDDAKWRNILVQEMYEPGSVMKIFTTAAAMQSGNFNPNAYFQAGSINVDGQVIRDWDYMAPKTLNFMQALYHSSNVGMILLEQKMDSKWEEYLKQFGFLQSTHSGLPYELSGSGNFKTPVDRAMTAFGQGISVTPMQILQASTSIANGGKMIKPSYIEKIKNPNDNQIEEMPIDVISQPISETTAQKVLEILQQTVDNKYLGTGIGYKIPNYATSVKTGTAQIFENGRYTNDPSNYLYSMIQFAPTQNPEYIVYAMVKRPDLTKGATAEDIIAKITVPLMERILKLDPNVHQYQLNKEQTQNNN